MTARCCSDTLEMDALMIACLRARYGRLIDFRGASAP